ncbi:heterokaryon incompatibility protein-domain-containing protein [Truncatella angustata]|uniref:Heterokaryon incompatibility protein-domain-containing protein n=1 Tax=Truncatella angustata TaxID=152316 RepID=A0A9P8UWZ6_9PEZI|nr:heterokaryon incompatibility protein-domain-containing protein [Truncatella angustata]KAH6659767.1 heterokaryon incompatibility protein-domain-containing protein [Truncatella angustata]KAH8203105.1 hypothetical protein TruAng_002738 [Truncatella angustata]
MRLLNVKTRKLEEHYGDRIPPYAILSHTWGAEEITYKDFQSSGYASIHGYDKIDGCCRQAEGDDVGYVWVDTCCIDKSSSAELSEAINSMYEWYEKSAVCYVYLSDVPADDDPYELYSAFRFSRWFTRGWTLQEFLAPRKLRFFNNEWTRCFGTDITRPRDKTEQTMMDLSYDFKWNEAQVCNILAAITGIGITIVSTGNFEITTMAQRFSWAAHRKTTRVEDMAYCLLGILRVKMPLLYGEGEAAFQRLQEVAINTRIDQSYLCWGLDMAWPEIAAAQMANHVLARSPLAFQHCGGVRSLVEDDSEALRTQSVINQGLQLEVDVLPVKQNGLISLALLACYRNTDDLGLAIPVVQLGKTHLFRRLEGIPPFQLLPSANFTKKASRRTIVLLDPERTHHSNAMYYSTPGSDMPRWLSPRRFRGRLLYFFGELREIGFDVDSYYPPVCTFDPGRSFVKKLSIDLDKFNPGYFAISFRRGKDRIAVYFDIPAGLTTSSAPVRVRAFKLDRGSLLSMVLAKRRRPWRPAWLQFEIDSSESCANPGCRELGHLHLSHVTQDRGATFFVSAKYGGLHEYPEDTELSDV